MNAFVLDAPEQTQALGAALARALLPRRGVVVFLEGPLGAGKTTLVRGVLRRLGVRGAVRSPTYTLLEPYDAGGQAVLHLDLYRLTEPRELLGLGLSDYGRDATWIWIEWPERAAGLLPDADLRIRLGIQGEARQAQLDGPAATPEFIGAVRRLMAVAGAGELHMPH